MNDLLRRRTAWKLKLTSSICRVEHLAEREGITKYEAYGRFLSTAEGMRLLADLRLTKKRYGEESDLRFAAQRLEEDTSLVEGRHGPQVVLEG